MLKAYLHRKIAGMEKEFGYDATYAHEMLDASLPAFLKFALAQAMGAHRQGVPRDAWFSAQLAAVMQEDCGPCAQLGVDKALKMGVSPRLIAALIRGDLQQAGEDAALGFRYGRAIAANAIEAVELSSAVEARYGKRGQVSLALAVAAVRVYPTLKRGMGHGAACRRLVVADDVIPVRQAA